jgi:hypothetical protein
VTLTEFLLACVAEDEAAAREWQIGGLKVYDVAITGFGSVTPALVLAQCAAVRAVVALHADHGHECATTEDASGPIYGWYARTHDCQTLRLIAQPYEGRPGWDAAWKVGE